MVSAQAVKQGRVNFRIASWDQRKNVLKRKRQKYEIRGGCEKNQNFRV